MFNTDGIKNATHQYLIMFKLYVRADGSLVVMMGNQRLEVSADEVCALLYGTLEYAKVFEKLHQQIDTTALSILTENSRANGN